MGFKLTALIIAIPAFVAGWFISDCVENHTPVVIRIEKKGNANLYADIKQEKSKIVKIKEDGMEKEFYYIAFPLYTSKQADEEL